MFAFNFSFCQSETGAVQFWEKLNTYCGQSFEGEITAGGKEGDGFVGKKLLMHVRSCEENRIRIPFFVGDDKSRTWVLTLADNILKLKHDHRHEDGSPDKVTQYGGRSTNSGLPEIQFFPADQETSDLIPAASTNVWWITVDEKSFTYNLKRVGTDRIFSVSFDTTKPVETPSAPWGWEK
ncbi:hypothetical protein GCM10007940_01130 [Portibacter lacus]|uniref:Secreted protein n=2 Tax=Portibacter lacus TaxID=1099794 RepID=A0AA37SMU4_9BACT|nr:hypothetical protein GCM10007940_01130 [Portibacter lacus]